MELTVFVVDDDRATREALTFLIRKSGRTCRAYDSAAAFLDQMKPEHQGCLIADIRMPEMDGIALAQRLRDLGCKMPVILITGHADVPTAIQAIRAGVQDFIEKPLTGTVIRQAVDKSLTSTRNELTETMRREMVKRRLTFLTEREAQILAMVVKGTSNKAIAADLQISPRTVEIHRANMMVKMEADNLAELVRMVSVCEIAW